jgi:hypothetical protein
MFSSSSSLGTVFAPAGFGVECVVDLDAEVADDGLELRVAEKRRAGCIQAGEVAFLGFGRRDVAGALVSSPSTTRCILPGVTSKETGVHGGASREAPARQGTVVSPLAGSRRQTQLPRRSSAGAQRQAEAPRTDAAGR